MTNPPPDLAEEIRALLGPLREMHHRHQIRLDEHRIDRSITAAPGTFNDLRHEQSWSLPSGTPPCAASGLLPPSTRPPGAQPRPRR
ncbi:hypothetical protein ACIQXD_32940 [Streptomyces uncialis]|uniref:hypothetical protein n=1 Tax=Streptomyces uncialis TaxID=1048205 RepID=UPI003821D6CF